MKNILSFDLQIYESTNIMRTWFQKKLLYLNQKLSVFWTQILLGVLTKKDHKIVWITSVFGQKFINKNCLQNMETFW